jgi:hypothetical protein
MAKEKSTKKIVAIKILYKQQLESDGVWHQGNYAPLPPSLPPSLRYHILTPPSLPPSLPPSPPPQSRMRSRSTRA